MKKISLYIHIPFCEKKCYYCDFNSYSGKEHLIEDYVNALCKEMGFYQEALLGYEVETVFFGGGTPSVLSGGQIEKVMDCLKTTFTIGSTAEISLEANPGLLTKEKLESYYQSGINRLSMGLQACQNHLLTTLGRIHTYEEFVENLADAKKVGFTNINGDLMFALPGQRMEDWEESLKKMVSLDIPHISAYSLIVEEGTPFYDWVENKKIRTLEEELELAMYHRAISYLKAQGYVHYEISNFAKPGYECRHNKVYWYNQSYIGLGAGAHGHFKKQRFRNKETIEEYIGLIYKNQKPIEEITEVTQKEAISETMFLGLRLTEGIDIKKFEKRFQISPFTIYGEVFEKFRSQELLDWNHERLYLTEKGIDLSNQVFQEMLID